MKTILLLIFLTVILTSCNDASPVAHAQTTGGFGSTTIHITVGLEN
jgi:hypothetical protein